MHIYFKISLLLKRLQIYLSKQNVSVQKSKEQNRYMVAVEDYILTNAKWDSKNRRMWSVSRVLQSAAAVAIVRLTNSFNVFTYFLMYHVAFHGYVILVILLPIVFNLLDQMLSRLHRSLQQLRTSSSRHWSTPRSCTRFFTSWFLTQWYIC